jgi:hypothetical protein
MPQLNDLSRSLAALDQNSTIIAVVELSHSSWLVGGVVPGIERQPRKKLPTSTPLPLAFSGGCWVISIVTAPVWGSVPTITLLPSSSLTLVAPFSPRETLKHLRPALYRPPRLCGSGAKRLRAPC